MQLEESDAASRPRLNSIKKVQIRSLLSDLRTNHSFQPENNFHSGLVAPATSFENCRRDSEVIDSLSGQPLSRPAQAMFSSQSPQQSDSANNTGNANVSMSLDLEQSMIDSIKRAKFFRVHVTPPVDNSTMQIPAKYEADLARRDYNRAIDGELMRVTSDQAGNARWMAQGLVTELQEVGMIIPLHRPLNNTVFPQQELPGKETLKSGYQSHIHLQHAHAPAAIRETTILQNENAMFRGRSKSDDAPPLGPNLPVAQMNGRPERDTPFSISADYLSSMKSRPRAWWDFEPTAAPLRPDAVDINLSIYGSRRRLITLGWR